jgi:hypothetical protein
MRFVCTARRWPTDPDVKGFYSSGYDLPAFYVEAASATEALGKAHAVAGEGLPGGWQTSACVVSTDACPETAAQSVENWR